MQTTMEISTAKRKDLAGLWIVIPIWCVLVGIGMFWLIWYGNTSNSNAAAPEEWPEAVEIGREKEGSTLMVFVHPHCPCSHATIGELERLTAQLGATVPTFVVFLHPDGAPPGWHETSLWIRARELPGVTVIDDISCTITHAFGVETSGQVLLYDSSGSLRFRGGITAARGHSGDSFGRDSIMELVRHESPSSVMGCAVYGCPLHELTSPFVSPEPHQGLVR